MKNKYLLIGHFSDDVGDGQVVRTKTIKESLYDKLGQNNVEVLNIKKWKRTPIKLFFSLLFAIIKHKKIILMTANRGVKFVSRLAFNFKDKQIFYIMIGGSFPAYLKENNFLLKRAKKFQGIFVQTETIVNKMEALGFKNIFLLPNFKNITFLNQKDLVKWQGNEKVFKVCTLSRVTKSKGITDAIEGVLLLNKELKSVRAELDIFGNIDPNYEKEFLGLINNSNIHYKGYLPHDKTHFALKDYFLILFPTYYFGEGFAGTILDALYAGIPVVASNWNSNADIIHHMENGIVININSPNEIKDAILYLINNINARNEMGLKNYQKSLEYASDKIMGIFYEILFK